MHVTASDLVAKFALTARPGYVAAFKTLPDQLEAAQIDTPLRLTHFMAQVLHETGALSILIESGRYSAKNLGAMWDSGNWHKYFANRAACVAMADTCVVDGGMTLFSLVYGNRMGNGGPDSKDGWTYRGRGVMQTTGRDSYRSFGQRCAVDFESNPDLIVSAEHALKPALMEWTDKHLNIAADHNDIEAVTRGINGGLVGLTGRKAWFAKLWPAVIGAPPVQQSTEWRVQAALALAGYDTGSPDGDVGPRTRLAIIAYRTKNGLIASNQITPDLVQALGL